MKKRRIIILIGLVLVCVVAFGFWLCCHASKAPVLVFTGYEQPKTDGTRIARFELRNVSDRNVYTMSYFCGPQAPTDRYLMRSVVKDGTKTQIGPNVYMRGKLTPTGIGPTQIQSNEMSQVKIILPIGSGPEQIGIRYYTGHYTNAWDFANALSKTYVLTHASWKERFQHPVTNFKAWLNRSVEHESWCPEILQP